MTIDQAITKVLDLAESEVGYHEEGDNLTKYAAELDSYAGFYNGPKDGFAWCDVFVDWLFVKSFGVDIGREMLCQPLFSAGAGCLYSAQYYKQAGRWFTSPQPGDQVFFSYSSGEVSHTGIVTKVAGGAVYTVEGNTSDKVGEKCYFLSSSFIIGYGRPRWELAADMAKDETASETPATPDWQTCAVGLPVLKRGNKGAPVERLQTLLIARGYNCGGRVINGREVPDGDFGPATEQTIVSFQRSNALEQDGCVGQRTWETLIKR